MAALNASSVAYTQLLKPRKDDSSFRNYEFKLVFGDGSSTYPALGIPLTNAKLGCPVQLREFILYSRSGGDGYEYKYDVANNSIRIYQVPAAASLGSAAPMVELGAVAVAATTLYAVSVGY